jgi:hypothetical protein
MGEEERKVTRRIFAVVASVIALAAAAPPDQTGTGAISGTIVDEAGQPQPGAQLRCQKLTEYTRDIRGRMVLKEPGFVRSVVAGSGGKFALSDLPPGRYHLCAVGGRPNQVGSCEWGGVAVIALATGENIQNVVRTVREGAVITLRVADPNRRIVLPDSRGIAPRQGRFSLELVSPTGSQRRAERISSSPVEHVFQITVPKQWPMRLFLDTDLRLTDEAGKHLEVRRPTAQVISAAGRDQLTVNLLVP